MRVFVIADTDGPDVVFRLVGVRKGSGMDDYPTISPLFRLPGQNKPGCTATSGNPYALYGDAAADWTGRNKFDLGLTVATVSSGSLCTKGESLHWEE